MAHYIVHSSIDENRKARGGAAGDQTGKEVCTRTWYSKPWDMVLRCPDASIAENAREIAIKLANSNLVGYDQCNRNSLYQELKKNNWDVDAYIASGVKTESDCSSFVYAVYACLMPEMRSDANAPTTSVSKNFYKKYGFTVFTDDKYTKSAANLQRGDLINKASGHIVMYCGTDVNVASLQTAVKVMPPVASSSPNLKKGSKGTQVKYLQQDLNYIMGCNLDADGDFGKKTLDALKSFQEKYGLEIDGVYGGNSNAKMRELFGFKTMKTNDAGIELIKRYESCRLKAYKLEGEKYYTIGWGHSFDSSVNADTVWTQEQCDNQLRKDIEKFERYVNDIALGKFPALNDNQFSALVSYTYNRGQGGLKQLINNSDSIKELSDNIVVYWGGATRYKTGLVNRRKVEKALFDATDGVVTAKVTAKSGLRMRKANGSSIKTITYDRTVTVEQKDAMVMNISNVNYMMAKVTCDNVTGYVAQKYLKF